MPRSLDLPPPLPRTNSLDTRTTPNTPAGTHTPPPPELRRTRSLDRPQGFPERAGPKLRDAGPAPRAALPPLKAPPANPAPINPAPLQRPVTPPAVEIAPAHTGPVAEIEEITAPAARDIEALTVAQHPKEASDTLFMLMQLVRHAGPVAGTRTVVQGLAGPALAHAVEANPETAIIAQGALTVYSLTRRILSQIHSERAAPAANAAFMGDVNQAENSTPRQRWQAIQSAGILAGDVTALALTVGSKADPRLVPLAQTMASIQVRAHALAQGREFLRSTINTVHVGSAHGERPADGRNLRAEDIDWQTSLRYGGAVGVVELITQCLMAATLGGKTAWHAGQGLAVGAGVIAGVANTVTSSTEDFLVDKAAAKRMQQTDPSHVQHIHWDSKNPLTGHELGRQFERVDMRVFNQMLPAMIAAGVLFGIGKALPEGTAPIGKAALGAVMNAVISSVMMGSLLGLTTRSYQMNDAARR